MADVGSLFCNKVLQKQSAQKNESLEWLDFVSSISNFCWILCTCHYGLGDMGYVAFWMMPKGNEKREIQQNPLPLPLARSEKGNENRGNPRNPLPFSACEAGKGNEKRGKREIRLLVSPTPRKKKKQVITEVKGNAPAAAPRRQDAALPRSLVFLWQLRL